MLQPTHMPTVIGAGGDNPRVVRLTDPDSSLSLPAGHSVYALQRSHDGEQFVAGTKHGSLFLFNFQPSGELRLVSELNQGAPVLAIAWGASSMISSDTRGRCLRWRPPFTSSPEHVCCEGVPFCALVAVGEETWGQTLDGRVLCFADDASAPEIVHEGGHPPRPYGWVNGVSWRAADALVFPVTAGSFTVVDRSTRGVRTLKAHTGDAFACCLYGDLLVTLGREDNCARMWHPDLSLCQEAAVPPGLAGIALTSDPSAPFVAIDETGNALRIAFADARLECRGEMLSGPFRAVCGITPEEHEAVCEQESVARASEIAGRSVIAIETRDTGSLPRAAHDLRTLGHHEAALALEAEAAAVEGDICTQLACRLELAECIEDSPKCLPSILKLVYLLAALLRFERACDFLGRISHFRDEAKLGDLAARIERLADAAGKYECVASIESGLAPTTVLQSFDVLGLPPWRWLLARCFPELQCRGLTVRPCDYTAILQMLWDAWPSVDRPKAELTELWLLSSTEAVGPETYVLLQWVVQDADGLDLALRFRQGGSGTTVTPMLVCDVHRMAAAGNSTWSARAIELQAIVEVEHLPAWIRAALSDARKALGSVLSDQLAEVRRGGCT